VSVGVGLGHVFVYEGNTLGDKLNIGGSLRAPLREIDAVRNSLIPRWIQILA